MPYAIVVDVNVARSASLSGKPVPEACRKVLEAIMDNSHRLAMSKEVYNEWMKITTSKDGTC